MTSGRRTMADSEDIRNVLYASLCIQAGLRVCAAYALEDIRS